MEPIAGAFAELWPEARCTDLLEDSLPADRAAEGDLSRAMVRHINALADYALLTGADGNRLAAERACDLAHCVAIMLAQFSTSRAKAMVGHTLGRGVLTAPSAAVAARRDRIGQRA
ncbi:hypothetical protein [Ancylobacter lacus]|uniref:hypothetical protein n=1 Tax=Ancylobacter lacus TaxID=2579970 RepID=UPI0031B81586